MDSWIERLSQIKGRDMYSQNGEGLLLEYIFENITHYFNDFIDIGGGDGFYLSNTKHLKNLGWEGIIIDSENGDKINLENCFELIQKDAGLISIDIDGNDYWILEKLLLKYSPSVIVAEYNPALKGSVTIKYNSNHIWDGTKYYGFSFEAGIKLGERFGYSVIYVNEMNMFFVKNELIDGLKIPEIKPHTNDFFAQHMPDLEWVEV